MSSVLGHSTKRAAPADPKRITTPFSNLQAPPLPLEEGGEPVPSYLHKVVIYSRRGEKPLTEAQKTVFRFVQVHYLIPKDLESSHKYGPLSGRAYEERVITAYMNGLLEIKPEFEHLRGAEEMKVCYECGKPGHFPQDCLDRL